MNTDARYGNPKRKSEPLRITAPLNYDVKVWRLLVDFFILFFDVGSSLPVYALGLSSLCDIAIQFVPALARTWKQLPQEKEKKKKKSHIRVWGPWRSEHCRIWQRFWSEVRGEEDEEDAEEEEVLCFDWKRDFGHVLYIRSIFYMVVVGKMHHHLKV